MQNILDYLDVHGSVTDDSVAYKTKDFPFTWEDFQNYTDQLWKEAGSWDRSNEYYQEDETFETYYVPFEKNGKKYVMTIMYGQGSAWTLYTEAEFGEYLKYLKKCRADGDLPRKEMSDEKSIDVLRFALAAVWTETEKDSPNAEEIGIIAHEALKLTQHLASPGKEPSVETGLESWEEFKKRRKLKMT